MQKQHNISISVAIAILLALTIVGSIWDFEIANAIYLGQTPTENIFGCIFSYIGVIPTFVGWSFLGASIFCLAQKQIENAKKRRWLTVFAVLLFALSFFYYCNTLYFSNTNAFQVHIVVAYSIGITVIGVAAYLGYRLAKKCKDTNLLNKLLFLATVSLLTLLTISITKELMCRPRFRMILNADGADYFRNWWQSGRALKASLGEGIVTDEFASLPSGHSAHSMFAVFLFPSLADYICRFERYRPIFFALGFVWWALTAFSRLTIGAHYLTDVTIAGLVTILSYAIVSVAWRIYRKRKGISAIK